MLTKYDIGQKVWFIHQTHINPCRFEALEGEVEEIFIRRNAFDDSIEICYTGAFQGVLHEQELYPSLKDLKAELPRLKERLGADFGGITMFPPDETAS